MKCKAVKVLDGNGILTDVLQAATYRIKIQKVGSYDFVGADRIGKVEVVSFRDVGPERKGGVLVVFIKGRVIFSGKMTNFVTHALREAKLRYEVSDHVLPDEAVRYLSK